MENDMIVFVTESGSVYYCPGNYINDKKMLDVKELPIRQVQCLCNEDGVQLLISKSQEQESNAKPSGL